MQYTEVTFNMEPAEPWNDLLAADLGEIGFESFVTSEEGLVAYIDSREFDEEKMKGVETLNLDHVKISISVKPYEVQNWNEKWESNFKPIDVEGKCLVYASFHNIEGNYDYRILIDPKMSFGTGHHATTYLILREMLDEDFSGKKVLDMGSGTAVLAILASMKGAAAVTAIDNNEWAFENARENVEKNNITNVEVLLGDETEIGSEKYNTIIANINKNIILSHLPIYAEALEPNGELFTSGFFEADATDIAEEAEKHGLKFIKKRSKDNWCVVHFQKA